MKPVSHIMIMSLTLLCFVLIFLLAAIGTESTKTRQQAAADRQCEIDMRQAITDDQVLAWDVRCGSY